MSNGHNAIAFARLPIVILYLQFDVVRVRRSLDVRPRPACGPLSPSRVNLRVPLSARVGTRSGTWTASATGWVKLDRFGGSGDFISSTGYKLIA